MLYASAQTQGRYIVVPRNPRDVCPVDEPRRYLRPTVADACDALIRAYFPELDDTTRQEWVQGLRNVGFRRRRAHPRERFDHRGVWGRAVREV